MGREVPDRLRVAGRDYHPVRKIGEGGFGEVYLATDPDGQRYALKILHAVPTPERVESFKNEFFLLTQLKHPYLCAAHDFAFSDSLQKYLIVSDYVDGQDFFRATAVYPVGDIESLSLQILEVLDYLHRHLIIHFDIKCTNLLVSTSGGVKLLDFGVAHLESNPLKQFPGSLPYAAPEILNRRKELDHRVDLYSLGIVLFRALTRRYPFPDNHPETILDWHLNRPISWRSEEVERIPVYLRDLLEALLKKSPAQRISQAAAASNWIHLHRGSPTAHPRKSLPPEGRLIAREDELRAVEEALGSGEGKILVYHGEEGMGRSRLLRETKYLVEMKEANCLWFDNFYREDGRGQIARQLEARAVGSWDAFLETTLSRLKKLVSPTIFVDDLQDADPLFQEWLAQISENLPNTTLFVGWKGGLPKQGPLGRLFQRARVLPLRPLNSDEIFLYLTEAMGEADLPHGSLDWLVNFSNGTPLLVSEGIRYLLEQGGEGKLPGSIERLYENRLLPLSPLARKVLEALSLWKQPVTLPELRIGVSGTLPTIAKILPMLLESGLVVRIAPWGAAEVQYTLANEALARFLVGQLEPEKRKRLQRRILTYLKTRKETPLSELASYALEIGDPKEVQKYLWGLAETYRASYQTGKAIRTYEQLLPYCQGDAAVQLKEKLIPLLVLAGRPDEALRLLPSEGWIPLPDRKLKGWVLTRIGRFEEAIRLYEEGLMESSDRSPLHAEILNSLGNVYLQMGNIDEACRLFERTFPEGEVSDQERFRLTVNNNLPLALALQGETDRARQCEGEKMALFQRLGDQHQVAASLTQLGFVEFQAHRYYEASSLFKRALELSEELGDLHNILIVLDHLMTLAQRRGLYHEALSYLRKATHYRMIVSPPYQLIQNYLKEAFLYLSLHLGEAAKNSLKKIEATAVDGVPRRFSSWIHLAWGYYHRITDHPREARDSFEKAASLAEGGEEPDLPVWSHYALGDLWVEKKRWQEAADEYRKARQRLSNKSDEELKLRLRLMDLVLQKEGSHRPSEVSHHPFLALAKEAEEKGLLELAAECYAWIDDPRAGMIYHAIAAKLPEEYRIGYLKDPFKKRVLEEAPPRKELPSH